MRKALLPLLLVTVPVIAQPIYSYKDNNGNIVYTNQQPPANTQAEEVKLPKIQTMPAENLQKALKKETENNSQPNNKQPTISNVVISGIPSDEALRANNGTFTVTVSFNTTDSVTSLPATYLYALLLDGKLYAGPQADPKFILANIDRGTHSIQAQVVKNGQIVATSNVETFTLQRVKVNKVQPRINKPAKSK